MTSAATTAVFVVSAILLALQCVDCAPGSEVSEKNSRAARYIAFGQTKENSVAPTVKQHNNYENKAADNGSYDNNAGNNGNLAGYLPNDQSINNDNSIINTGSQSSNNGLSLPPVQPQEAVGFAALVSSFWDMVLAFIRGTMGIKRREPPRIARAFIGAAVGNDECMKASACHAGRMMRALDNNALYFTVAEMVLAEKWKPVIRRVRRATEDKEDCNLYNCDI